jgi:hypothetical protein
LNQYGSWTPRKTFFSKLLVDQQSATNLLVGKAHIVNALDRWVLGERVYGKKRGEFLDRLKPPPPDIWEIRVTVPAIRALCRTRYINSHQVSYPSDAGQSGIAGVEASYGGLSAMLGIDVSQPSMFHAQ